MVKSQPSFLIPSQDQLYDLAIIGGGINGVAIARDAAMRGMKTILFEKTDFGSGASTKTSKLAHGGLRYLEHCEFGLVKESMHERFLLLKNAPHLVLPLAFVIPVYKDDPHPFWQIKLGLSIYDYLGKETNLPKYKSLSKEEVIALFPGLKSEGLKGGCLYYDAIMKDNRLIMENILSAEQYGSQFFNYTTVTGLRTDKEGITGVEYWNSQQKIQGSISAKAVVNCTGAWSDQIIQMDESLEFTHTYPTKGVHVVIPQVSANYALILRAPQDQRIFFLIPWEGNSLLGTTDTIYHGDPDEVHVKEQDQEYLYNALGHHFPELNLNNATSIATFAGLRPLTGKKRVNPSFMSRTHKIHRSSSKLISVLGGKFTTHRKVAQEVVDVVSNQLKYNGFSKCLTAETPLIGAINRDDSEFCAFCLREFGLKESQARHLFYNYGINSQKILSLVGGNLQDLEQICPLHPHIMAEVVYAIKYEHALRLEDWFLRRTSIGYSPCRGEHCAAKVSLKFAELLGWDESCREKSLESFLKLLILQ